MNCPNCSKDIVADRLFCHWCEAFVPNIRAGTKAGLFRRWFACVIDPLIGIALYLTILVFFGGITSSVGGDATVGAIVLATIGYIVFSFWFLSRGMTPGKWLLGERVVEKLTGNYPGFWRMLLRETIGKFVSGIFLGLGYFWAIWDKDNQAWHDKIAGTVVVRRSGSSNAQGHYNPAGSAVSPSPSQVQPQAQGYYDPARASVMGTVDSGSAHEGEVASHTLPDSRPEYRGDSRQSQSSFGRGVVVGVAVVALVAGAVVLGYKVGKKDEAAFQPATQETQQVGATGTSTYRETEGTTQTSAGIPAEYKQHPIGELQVPAPTEVVNDIVEAMVRDNEIAGSCVAEQQDKAGIANVMMVDLNNDGRYEFVVEGNPPCAYGARRPMYWVYKKIDDGYQLLVSAGQLDSVSVSDQMTNGYRDIAVVVAGANVDQFSLRFDGYMYK